MFVLNIKNFKPYIYIQYVRLKTRSLSLTKYFHLFRFLQTCRNAALSRQSSNRTSPNHLQSVQGGMTEDEALAHALARSIQELDESHDRNRRNRQQERQQQQTVPCGGDTKDKCSLS